MRTCVRKDFCDLDHWEELLKTSLLLFALGLGWTATTIPVSLAAQDDTPEDTTSAAENFELSLFPGVQLRGEDSAIRILRLGLYNKNVSVKGLDIGIVNQTTGGLSKGLQVGVVGFVESDFRGWQSNLVISSRASSMDCRA